MRSVMLRPGKTGVSPVIGTILMVAITVVLAAVLYVMVSGVLVTPQSNNPTMTLSSGSWSGGNISLQITAVSTSTLKVTDLTFQVQSRTGTPCYTGAANGANQTGCSGVTVGVTYTDSQGEGNVDTLDTIRITANPNTDVRGGLFKVSKGSTVLAQINLPS